MKPIIILGSSRSFGGTRKAVDSVVGSNNIPLIDLQTFQIAPYDYSYSNKKDDYLGIMERVINHNLIVLATPVYWYTMSATMKTFIDRLSDLLDIRKDIGRKLRGKRLYVIASFDTSLPKSFEDSFEQTCNYMGMHYQGCSFIYGGSKPELQKNNEAEIIKARNILFAPMNCQN